MLNKVYWAIVLGVLSFPVWAQNPPQCLFVSSYHEGYAWSDGVARGLHKVLDGKCQITKFNMDAKRHTSEAHARQAALEAKALIETLKPDVIIAADDIASKYLIVPYYKNSDIPVVFCGVNWTVEQYGYPFSNVTGMIEVAAVNSLFQKAEAISGKIRTATYLGADTFTETKNLAYFQKASRDIHVTLNSSLSTTAQQWIKSYKKAQASDLIIVGSNAGINDWNKDEIIRAVEPVSKKLSVTNHGWMMPYIMFGMTKVPAEQGEWAGQLAIEIIKGTKPSSIPIVPNRKFDIIINQNLLNHANIAIPEFIKLKAQSFHE